MKIRISGPGLIFCALLTNPIQAQPASPQQTSPHQESASSTLYKFVSLNNQSKLDTAGAKKILAGEALSFSRYKQLGPMGIPNSIKSIDASNSVGRVSGLSEEKVPLIDLYIYLQKSGGKWRVTALRSMAMTGIMEAAREELQKKASLTAREKWDLENLKLTLMKDSELRAYFQQHQQDFTAVATLFRQASQPRRVKTPVTPGVSPLDAKLKSLFLTQCRPSDEGGWNLLIGGISDNEVIYHYSPENRPPRISPSDNIWVEKLAENWFLVRTT